MSRFVLMKTQKNTILRILDSKSLNPPEFTWEEVQLSRIPMVVDSGIVSKLLHIPTGYFFEFDIRKEKDYRLTFSPGDNSPNEHVECLDWEGITIFTEKWASYLKREIDATDLWEIIRENMEFVQYADSQNGHVEFTDEQKAKIKIILKDIKDNISTNHLETREQINLLEDKFDYLNETVDRMARRDWIHTAIGVFVTLMVGLGLAPEKAQIMANHIQNVFSNAWTKLIGN